MWIRSRYLKRGAPEPVFETGFTESWVIARNQRVLIQLGSKIPRVRVRDNLARIVAYAQGKTDTFVETKLFGPRYFNGAIQWRPHRHLTNRTGNIIRRDRLEEHMRKMNRIAAGGGV